MFEVSAKISKHGEVGAGVGGMLITLVGLVAAFCAASTSALPLLLSMFGADAGWVDSLGGLSASHGVMLMAAGGFGLTIGAAMLWFVQQDGYELHSAGREASIGVRLVTMTSLVGGGALLLATYCCRA